MYTKYALLFTLLLSGSSSGRFVSRNGAPGNVNLVEFNIRGVIHGQCSFRSPSGEEIMVIYEEYGPEQMSAKSFNPTVVDPVSKAQECRQAATQPPTSELQGRSGTDGEEIPQAEIEAQILQQFADFDRNTRLNQEYMSHLQPRFIGKIIGLGLGLKALGSLGQQEQYGHEEEHDYQSEPTLSFGGLGGHGSHGGGGSFFPGIHIVRHIGGGMKGYGDDHHDGYDKDHGIGHLKEEDKHRYSDHSHSIGSLKEDDKHYHDEMHGVGSLKKDGYGYSSGYQSHGGIKHPLASLSGIFSG